MADLARHVRDIDIYRTRDDKAAYNGGLFWHTSHYTDADTATHRTYPRGAPGGGPSAEHNYNAGLMFHYFMTGERASRETAIGLARWVIDMDDGRQTPFRVLAGGATGLASATGSIDYHGPGRAPANSISAAVQIRGSPTCSRQTTPITRPSRRIAASIIDVIPSGTRYDEANSLVRGSSRASWPSMARPNWSASK